MFGQMKMRVEKEYNLFLCSCGDDVRIRDNELKSNILRVLPPPRGRLLELTIRTGELTELVDLTTIETF